MIPKSSSAASFYRLTGSPDGAVERVEALPTTAGPWSSEAQHGGPPAALSARAIEALGAGVVGRFTMELLGPVPVAPLDVSAYVVRPGRTVSLVRADVRDPAGDRPVATSRAWVFPRSDSGAGSTGPALPHGPADGSTRDLPTSWSPGYLDAVEWRWISGGVDVPGPGVVWMRPPGLVEGEPLSPLQRLLACVDSASGVSAMLDIREWAFLNTELTVHVLREPVGEWVCLEAATMLGPGAVGVATSKAYDERGPVARSAQALLVQRR
jgi:Acyl-CoA thioesterase C-terminal domain/Acyl-CoA thioesterase N-terminal domain